MIFPRFLNLLYFCAVGMEIIHEMGNKTILFCRYYIFFLVLRYRPPSTLYSNRQTNDKGET